MADENGNIHRISRDLIVTASYNSPYNEVPESLDAGNGLKVLVFYKSGQEILFLNRSLSMSQKLPELSSNSFLIEMCSISDDGHLWYLDENLQKISKYNLNFRKNVLTKNLPDSLIGQINGIKSIQGSVALMIRNEVIFLDDNGLYIKSILLPDIENHIKGEHVISHSNSAIRIENIYSGLVEEFRLNITEITVLAFDGVHLYCSAGKTIMRYTVKLD